MKIKTLYKLDEETGNKKFYFDMFKLVDLTDSVRVKMADYEKMFQSELKGSVARF